MKTKILLFFFSLLFINVWGDIQRDQFSDIYLRTRVGSNPFTRSIVAPVTESAYFANNTIYINLSEVEETAIVNITNKTTGEIVFSNTFENVKEINIDTALFLDGEYSIEVILKDKQLVGDLTL